MEEEDFPYPTPFWCFNLQAFQALNSKSNPNQVIQNAAYVMEEEDLSFPTLFFFDLQTIQALNSKNNPEQAFQNAIATFLLLSHKGLFKIPKCLLTL